MCPSPPSAHTPMPKTASCCIRRVLIEGQDSLHLRRWQIAPPNLKRFYRFKTCLLLKLHTKYRSPLLYQHVSDKLRSSVRCVECRQQKVRGVTGLQLWVNSCTIYSRCIEGSRAPYSLSSTSRHTAAAAQRAQPINGVLFVMSDQYLLRTDSS